MAMKEKLNTFTNFLRYWYFQWELITCLYVMEPVEKAIFHTIFFGVVGIILYAGYSYIAGTEIAMWLMRYLFQPFPGTDYCKVDQSAVGCMKVS